MTLAVSAISSDSLSEKASRSGTKEVKNICASEAESSLNDCLYSLWPELPSHPHLHINSAVMYRVSRDF